MIKRKLKFSSLIFISSLAINVGAMAHGQSNDITPETLDINIQTECPNIAGLPEDSKMVTNFSHAKHADIYLKDNSSFSAPPYQDDLTCSACHPGISSIEDLLKKPACERLSNILSETGNGEQIKKYFHQTCLDCHKNMNKAEKKTGPIKCKECH